MQRYKHIIFTASLSITAWANVAAVHADQPERSYVIRADGMACAYCAYGIEKKLKKLQAVYRVDFDLPKGLVKVKMNCNAVLSEDIIRKLLAESGYTFRSMTEEKGSCDNVQKN